MDPLGIKRIVSIFEDVTGQLVPLTQTDLQKLADRLDEAGVMMATVTDLVHDADAILEGLKAADVPAHVKLIAELVQADAEKGLAAIGHFGELAQKLTAIAVSLRDGKHVHVKGLNFGGDLTIGGEVWIE
jgi:hypothetical protein